MRCVLSAPLQGDSKAHQAQDKVVLVNVHPMPELVRTITSVSLPVDGDGSRAVASYMHMHTYHAYTGGKGEEGAGIALLKR